MLVSCEGLVKARIKHFSRRIALTADEGASFWIGPDVSLLFVCLLNLRMEGRKDVLMRAEVARSGERVFPFPQVIEKGFPGLFRRPNRTRS